MKLAAAIVAILACSNSYAATPSATTDPALNEQKVAMSKPTTSPTDVNVVNFPAVQAVAGTVSVGNLPLGADGAVRVTSGCAPSRQTQYVSLIDGPVTIPAGTIGFVTDSVETAGFSRIGILVEGDVSWLDTRIEWGWGGTPERFGPVNDNRNVGDPGISGPRCQLVAGWGNPTYQEHTICVVSGHRVRLNLDNRDGGGDANYTALGVYLIP